MGICFKFKSETSYDSISLNDPYISVVSFKQKVYEFRYKGKKNSGLCFGTDFDINLFNAQTNDCYSDKMLIPNHTSVIIQRVPGGRRCKFIDTTTIVVSGSQIPKSSTSTSSTTTSIVTSSSSCGDIRDAFVENSEDVVACRKLKDFPDELVCRFCKQLMKDAALLVNVVSIVFVMNVLEII
ncbi:hypothetical protein M5689_016172 [Euphorbia peplus]|nr:hypothetical protein M5689_016172 [Euphorbia peplus]